jgi:hypothetical protein
MTMEAKMSLGAKREYIEVVKRRYKNSTNLFLRRIQR